MITVECPTSGEIEEFPEHLSHLIEPIRELAIACQLTLGDIFMLTTVAAEIGIPDDFEFKDLLLALCNSYQRLQAAREGKLRLSLEDYLEINEYGRQGLKLALARERNRAKRRQLERWLAETEISPEVKQLVAKLMRRGVH